MIVVVMGVSGSGKTTVGRLLAARYGWAFLDADELHSEANILKMRAGQGLDDVDRTPWLEALAGRIEQFLHEGQPAVVACSALKEHYRALLFRDPARMRLVYLRGDPTLIAGRLAQRTGHFASAVLLDSQLEALEEPEGAIVVDVSDPPERIVEQIGQALRSFP